MSVACCPIPYPGGSIEDIPPHSGSVFYSYDFGIVRIRIGYGLNYNFIFCFYLSALTVKARSWSENIFK